MPASFMPGVSNARRYETRYPGVTQRRIRKLVLHSTETASKWGCPGYGGGAAAPTMTVDPWAKRTWQHFPALMSARALMNPSSTAVSENQDEVAQIEIIGYSDAGYGQRYGSNLRDLDDAGYDYLAQVVAWWVTEHGVPVRTPSSWPTYPSSYGNSSARMSSGEYDRSEGILGHLHVSGNSHGDPTIDVNKLISRVKVLVAGGGTSSQVPTVAVTKESIARVQRALGAGQVIWGQDGVHDDTGVWDDATERQALAIRNALNPAREASRWDQKRWWHLVMSSKGRGSSEKATKGVQWAVGVATDGVWGPATDAAYLAFRATAKALK